jgi:CRP/FNR family transcriptional regulator, anaerobic regulatory protein
MTAVAVSEELQALYPALHGLDPGELAETLAEARLVLLPAGTALFGAGAPCRQFPFVLSGSIRVSKVGEGRELQLYRVGPGESCVLTSSCLVGSADYPASGVVEADVRLVVLSRDAFDALMSRHAPFRRYVFGLFAERLADLMGLVEAVAFHRLDRRVAAALLGRGRTVSMTHQQLADEVGSVREMVTRVLRGFADEGSVRLGRGSIEIIDAGALRRIASGA